MSLVLCVCAGCDYSESGARMLLAGQRCGCNPGGAPCCQLHDSHGLHTGKCYIHIQVCATVGMCKVGKGYNN